jgi:hypothetical protein
MTKEIIFEKPAVGINVYKNVFQAKKFLEEFEKEAENDWSEISWAVSGVGEESKTTPYRTSVSASLASLMPPYQKTDLSELFYNDIKKHIDRLVVDYINEYHIPGAVSEIWQILKYVPGAEYKAHFDHGPTAPRVFSMVAFMQSPEQGGELEFPHFDVTIAAEEGTVIYFPSSYPYLHIAHPVEKGIKYSMVTWFGY